MCRRFQSRPAGITSKSGRCTALYHVHLPKLQEAHVVEYDHENRIVAPGENFSESLASLHTTMD